jgi:hypothetical protein
MGVVVITHSQERMMHVHYKLQDVGKLCELCFIMLPQARILFLIVLLLHLAIISPINSSN